MKRIYLFALLLAFLPSISLSAQESKNFPPGTPTPPYMEHPDLPAIKILMLDSSTIFNTFDVPKGRPIVIMNFMPECEHCQKLTEKLLAGMDSLKDIRFYLISPMELYKIKRFYEKYELSKYPNIVVGKDFQWTGIDFFKIKAVPVLILYDKNKRLLETFENTVSVKDLLEASKKKSTAKGS